MEQESTGRRETMLAGVERGRIAIVSSEGYVVASLDRDGIMSLPIGTVGGNEYTVGDMVYFFVFRDGTGKIICKL